MDKGFFTIAILALFKDNKVFRKLLNDKSFIGAFIQDKKSEEERKEIILAFNKGLNEKYHKKIAELIRQPNYKRNYIYFQKDIECITFEVDSYIFDLYKNFKFIDFEYQYKLDIMKLASIASDSLFKFSKLILTNELKDVKKSLRDKHLYNSWYLFLNYV